jgi:Lrp/AsnC family transcriptional regulator for asnA, asnC and gidA
LIEIANIYNKIGKYPIYMDRTDEEIIAELRADGKATVKEIARKLGLPMSTVHHRIMKLEKEKTIKRYEAVPDYKKMGFGVSAFVFVTVDYDKIKSQEDVAKEIGKLENVDGAYIVTGETDILIKVRARDVEELNEVIVRKLRAINGVDKTRTSVVLKEID